MSDKETLSKITNCFTKLKKLAHYYDTQLDRSKISDNQELANQIFTKSCLTLEAIDESISENKEFNIYNISTLWTLTRILLEEYITLEYIFKESLSEEEQQFRVDLFRYHGVVEEFKLLKEISSEGENDLQDKEFQDFRQSEFKKIEREIARCKKNISKYSLIDQIPKDYNFYTKKNIINGEVSKYIKSKKLINDILKTDQAYAIYKLGSSFIHTSFYSLEQLRNLVTNISKGDFSKICICINLIRGCTASLIKKYTKIFSMTVDYKLLSELAFSHSNYNKE